MKSKFIFFDKGGLTVAFAKRVADRAKNYLVAKETELEQLQFFDVMMEVGEPISHETVCRGIKKKRFDKIPAMLDEIGMTRALINWLCDAENAHKHLVRDNDGMANVAEVGKEQKELAAKRYVLAAKAETILSQLDYEGSYNVKINLLSVFTNTPFILNSSDIFSPTIDIDYAGEQFEMLEQKHDTMMQELADMKQDGDEPEAEKGETVSVDSIGIAVPLLLQNIYLKIAIPLFMRNYYAGIIR